MNAVYVICDCCGDEVERIEIALLELDAAQYRPAGYTNPSDCEAEAEALKIAGYDGHGRCGRCGDSSYRARYAGYPIEPIVDAIVSVEGLNRTHLIATLETLLAHLRDAPEFVSLVTCNDEAGCIE